jgi:ketosteroid isomerase-like protein
MKRNLLVVLVSFALIAFYSLWAAHKPRAKNKAAAVPDRAYLQKIWDGWSTLDPSHVSQFYASGPHTFFDIAPLKYTSWDEYRANVTKVLADFKSAKFTVNDDADVHPAGSYSWATATVKEEMTHKNGKIDMGNFRWTVVFEKQGDRWLIVHEHVSAPLG